MDFSTIQPSPSDEEMMDFPTCTIQAPSDSDDIWSNITPLYPPSEEKSKPQTSPSEGLTTARVQAPFHADFDLVTAIEENHSGSTTSCASSATADEQQRQQQQQPFTVKCLFEKAYEYLNPGQAFRATFYLYSERKMLILALIHFVATMIIWRTFSYTSKMNSSCIPDRH
jgi:hypothetical protein